MKQRFFLLLTSIAFSLLTNAQDVVQPVAINAGDIQQLTVVDDMDIVLLQGKPGEGVSFDKDFSKKVDVRMFNNSMEISMVRYLSKKEKPTVIVFVNDLKKLTVIGNPTVKTRGVLNTSKLDLYVDGSPYVYLVTNGMINAYPMGDNEISVKKLPVESIKGF